MIRFEVGEGIERRKRTSLLKWRRRFAARPSLASVRGGPPAIQNAEVSPYSAQVERRGAHGGSELGIDPVLVEWPWKLANTGVGVQVGLVVGGGNLFRGLRSMPRDLIGLSDHMGMLATVMNCLAMRDALSGPTSPPP